MEDVKLAVILLVTVICVISATRPAPARRRISRRHHTGATARPGHRSPAVTHPDTISRNRWDRLDLVRAIGTGD